MKTKVEALEGNKKKLTVSFTGKEIDEQIAKTYKDFAFKYNFPGFRKGKAPRPVIDNALGAQAVVATVTGDIMDNMFPRALDDNDLIPIAQPSIDQADELVKPGKPFSFSAEIECTPEFELDSYEPVVVKLPSEEATDEEVDAQIEELRNYYYDFKDCSAATKVKKDSFVELAMSAQGDDGKEISSLQTDSRLYELGTNLFPAALDAGLVGMKKGEKKSIDVDMTEGDSAMSQGMPELKTITFDVEIKQVKEKVLPEIDDEWAKNTAGFEGIKELRERVAENVRQQKAEMLPRMRETETLYALGERLKGDIPESMCEAEEANLLQNFFQQVQQQGITFDAYLAQMGITADQFKEDLKKQAKDVTGQDLALDAWARHAELKITGKEITEEFVKSGAEDPKGLQQEWVERGQISMLRRSMLRNKALKQIMETLVVEPLDDEKKPAKKAAAKKPAAKKPAAKKTDAKKETAE